MKENDFEELLPNLFKVLFAPTFMTRAKKLKFVTSTGKIIPKEGSLRLYRYMRISNVREVLQGQLRCEVPVRWQDPFEKLFYKEPVVIGDKSYYVLCLCFVYDVNQGEESMWNTHGRVQSRQKEPEPLANTIIRATFDVQSLCKGLASAIPSLDFYFAPVDYSLSRREILQHWKARKEKPYSSIEEFIGEMLLKRNAFSYENEMRLFIVNEQPFNDIHEDFCLLGLKGSKSVITSVTLPPLPILNPREYDQRTYRKELEYWGAKLKYELHNSGYNGKIYQSRLYDVECKMENPRMEPIVNS